jgi:hypothetical protein
MARNIIPNITATQSFKRDTDETARIANALDILLRAIAAEAERKQDQRPGVVGLRATPFTFSDLSKYSPVESLLSDPVGRALRLAIKSLASSRLAAPIACARCSIASLTWTSATTAGGFRFATMLGTASAATRICGSHDTRGRDAHPRQSDRAREVDSDGGRACASRYQA